MASVGSLTVSLTTLSGKFGEGFRDAGRHLKDFGSRAQELGAKVTETGKKLLEFAGIAEAASIGGFAYLTHEAAQAIEKTGRLAADLGTTTEALLGMEYAAKHAGVETDEFAQSMRHLEKELGAPTTAVREALGKIGTGPESLMALSADKQFARIADGIKRLGTQSEKAAVATALFGRDGAKMLSVLDEGGGVVDTYTARVKKLGGSFSDLDAAKVTEANHALEDMHALFDAIFTKSAAALAPFITAASNAIIGLGTDGTSVADKIADGILDVSRRMLRLVDIVDALKGAFYGLGGLVYKFIEGTAWIANKLDKAGTHVYDLLGDAAGDTKAGNFFRGMAGRKFQDSQESGELMRSWSELADKAFAVSGEKFRAALDGERSMGLTKSLEDIIAKAHARAAASVNEKKDARSANTATERKRVGEQIAAGFTSFLGKTRKGLDQVLTSAGGAQAFGNAIHNALAFMKTLPKRAFDMGWRPAMDLQTTVHGTFSGEAAGRQAGAYTIAAKQLEQQQKMVAQLEALNANFAGGVPAP